MTKLKLRIAAIAAAAFIGVVAGAGCDRKHDSDTASTGSGSIAWSQDVAASLKNAARDGRPVMLDFFATWCGPCKLMDAQTYKDANVIAEMEHWQAVRVDVDRNVALARQYNIQAVPTLVFIRPEGSEITRLEGFASAGQLSHAMKDIRQRMTTNPARGGVQGSDEAQKAVVR